MKYKIYINMANPEYQKFVASKLKRNRTKAPIPPRVKNNKPPSYRAFYITDNWELILAKSILSGVKRKPYWFPVNLSDYMVLRLKHATRQKYLKPPETVED